MSTGQPPSDNTSGGDKRSESEEKSAVKAAGGPGSKRAQSVDDGWDMREAPTSSGGASRPSLTGRRESVPPTSSPLRGKFTVGALVGATQGSASPTKTTAGQGHVHRQQIGALPQRASISGASAAPITEPPPAPKTGAAAAHVQPQVLPGSRKITPSQPFAVQSPPSAPIAERQTTPSQPFTAQAPAKAADRRNTPPQSFAPTAPREAGAPQAVAGAQPSISAHHLREPELNEKTPRGIGAVTLDKPVVAKPEPTERRADPQVLSVAPIIPIAPTRVIEPAPAEVAPRANLRDELPPASDGSAEPQQAALRAEAETARTEPVLSQPSTTDAGVAVPAAAAVASKPPARAEVLDDPEGWEVPHEAAKPTIPVEVPAPATDAKPAASQERDAGALDSVSEKPASATDERKSASKVAIDKDKATDEHKSASKVAIDKDKATDERKSASKVAVTKDKATTRESKLRAAESEPVISTRAKNPTSQSKLARAGYVETELSGEFFIATQDGVDPSSHYQDDLLDERQRRSISPEVVARRARYRVVVVLVVVGFVLLLGAAIALKMLGKIR